MDDGASDEDLMQRYAAGDAQAFELLYERYKGPVFRYLLRHTRDREMAAELSQEVWMKIVHGRDRFRADGGFRSFLFTMAHNRMVDEWRSANRRRRWFESEDAVPEAEGPRQDRPDEALRISEGDRALRLALEALPREQMDAFLLKMEGGLDIDQIAHTMGVARETAKSRVRYAMEKLRTMLDDEVEHHG